MSAVVHAGLLFGRAYRGTIRIPVFAVMNLVQPMIWLLLFGQLFRRVVEIPGFAAPGDTYLEFIAPGVVMMTAMFGAAWAGTSFIQDMDRGVMDRLLASPASRAAMQVATMVWYAAVALVQGLVVLGVAWLCGARFDGGPLGILVLLLAAVLLTCLFAAMSNAFALLARSQEARDRAVAAHRAAADVPVVGGDGHAAVGRLGRDRRPVQPVRLGGGGRPRGALRLGRLGPGGRPARPARRGGADHDVAGHWRFPGLPRVRLTRTAAGRTAFRPAVGPGTSPALLP
ncbi:ABC transporter permease [Promicromonospora sp. NPDC057138]|uniref:ABC transporter permease n=1 Tax=Promicromonospora sp. NPDC057138 TaxID=3346031 RepID=UPI00363A86FF